MKFRGAIFLAALIPALANASGTVRSQLADQIVTSDLSKTFTFPSASQAFCGVSEAQTLTNKTLTTPAVDIPLFTQQATPSNPASGKNKLYFKSGDNLYKLNSSGTEARVDAPSTVQDLFYCSGGNSFTLTNTPASNSNVRPSIDGLVLIQGSSYDYTISGTTLTTTAACATGQRLLVIYDK